MSLPYTRLQPRIGCGENMRWRIGAAFGVLFVAAAASSHWWAAGDYRSMTAALLAGALVFGVLLGFGRSKRDSGS